MPIFEYRCGVCSSFFDHYFSLSLSEDISCVSCGSISVNRVYKSSFAPSKLFCPHDEEIDVVNSLKRLSPALSDDFSSCSGCSSNSNVVLASSGSVEKCKFL